MSNKITSYFEDEKEMKEYREWFKKNIDGKRIAPYQDKLIEYFRKEKKK